MARNAEMDGLDEDDTWFDSDSPMARGRGRSRLNLVILAGIVTVGVVGFVLGAFAAPTAVPDTAGESMRSRARAAEGTRPLSGAMLIERLDKAAQTGVMKPAMVAAPEPPKVAEVQPQPPIEPEPPVVAEVVPEPVKPTKPTKPTEATAAKPVEKLPDPPVAVVPPKDPAAEPVPTSVIEQALIDGKKHLDARRWADAKQAYERALAAAPGNTKALFGRGRASFELRQTAAAMKDFEAVLAVEPSHPNALLMAGSVSQELGRKDDAKRFYERYLDAWPTGRRAAEIKGLLERL